MIVRTATNADVQGWLGLRAALWEREAGDASDIALARANGSGFVAADGPDVIGFAEAAIRRDYVNGCDTSPVLFLEGIYVVPVHRRRGIARALVDAVAQWGRDRGCTEFASDASVDNPASHAMLRALGFAETERVVYFRRPLGGEG